MIISRFCILLQDKENKVINDAAENEKNESAKEEDVTANQAETPVVAPNTGEINAEAPSSEDKATEEIKEATPEPGSAAKPKKEKVKKRWSFRTLSFGKKDKQKPSKKDRKNEENKAVADSNEDKLGDEAESKPVEAVDEKPQESNAETFESKPLETVVETVVKLVENIELETAPVSEPVQAVLETFTEKTPEPIIVVAQPQETKVEEPVAVEEIPAPTPVEEPSKLIVEVIPDLAPEEKPVDTPEIIAQPIVEEPPAIPASPPPSQFSVFAESMNTNTVEENLPVPAEVVEVEVEKENGEEMEIDVEPVTEMVEKVLEQAVDRVQSEINEKAEDEELPPPPAEEDVETEPATEVVETQPASEIVVDVTQNGVGEHVDEPVETVKV